jgi:hypothetical protein
VGSCMSISLVKIPRLNFSSRGSAYFALLLLLFSD